jgi:mono/diheme cytochrome c family protein
MPRPAVTAPDIVRSATAGAKLFRQHCAACHGDDAAGTRFAPSLQRERIATSDERALFRYVTNGDLRRGMPSWSRLPEERRWQLVAYIQTLHR